MSKKSVVVGLMGTVGGAVFLIIVLRSADVEDVAAIMLQVGYGDVLGVIGCALVFAGTKALRWHWLISHLKSVPPSQLIGPIFAGSALNYGIPHGGELLRVWLVSKSENISQAALLTSIAIERLLDLVAVSLLGLIALLGRQELVELREAIIWILIGFVAMVLAAKICIGKLRLDTITVTATLNRFLPISFRQLIVRHLEQIIRGLGSLKRARTVVAALVLTILQWTLMAGCVWFSLRAVGVEVTPALSIVTMVFLVIGLTLPTAPGHVGTTQAAFLLGGGLSGLGNEEIIAASVIYNVSVPSVFVVCGVLYVVMRRFRNAARAQPALHGGPLLRLPRVKPVDLSLFRHREKSFSAPPAGRSPRAR